MTVNAQANILIKLTKLSSCYHWISSELSSSGKDTRIPGQELSVLGVRKILASHFVAVI